jgi:3-oxoacyl-[acyl-carrier protein] reductase
MVEIENKIAFVTGGGKGIGSAIVRSLADAGMNVIFTYSSSEGQAKKLTTELEQEGKKVTAVQMNVADAEQIRSVIENVGSQYGKIDVLVNNAGVFMEKAFAELSAGDLDWMMNVNFKGAFLTALYSEPYLSKGGRIVNVGSIVAESTPGKGNTLYAASKSALQGFTRGLARDLGEKGITVNLVQPGPVDTEMNPADAPFADFVRSRMAIPKYGQPEDIAALVTFLASAEAGYITGSIMTIDGGFIA